ncbi:MAG: M48 family metallopeptidase [Thermoguttaceae bacterium]
MSPCCTIVLWVAFAPSAIAKGPDPADTARHADSIQKTAQTAPVPVPEPSPKALSYYRTGNILWIVSQAWAILLPTAWLWSGFSARLRSAARRAGRFRYFIIAVYFLVYAIVTFVLDLPLAWYAGYVRQHSYGLSNQTLAKWFTDQLLGLAVSLAVGILFLWVPYLLLRKSPRRWWFYTSLLAVPFMFLAMLVAPIWIDPLFNRFGPMQDKELEAKILAEARRAGIEGGRVFQVDKSVDTNAVNAYVTGLGHTKRIVLWDTLLAKLDQKEVLFVMAHEMGHYVLNHVIQGILVGFLAVLAGLYAVHRMAGFLIRRFQGRFGFSELSDIASLPLLVLLTSVMSLVLSPAVLAYSRYTEHEADRFGLELTQNNHAAATAFVKLQQENLSNPRPGWLYTFWRGSHPSLGDRIDFANTYRPWASGRPLRYERSLH